MVFDISSFADLIFFIRWFFIVVFSLCNWVTKVVFFILCKERLFSGLSHTGGKILFPLLNMLLDCCVGALVTGSLLSFCSSLCVFIVIIVFRWFRKCRCCCSCLLMIFCYYRCCSNCYGDYLNLLFMVVDVWKTPFR